MANNRKVQGEIDKLLKKVQEGLEVYDDVAEKVGGAATQVLKERFEADLKKEIKKLQRLREQIKGHVANPEVKDKKALEKGRKDIEVKMESFKITERETKTKAYSKEGLAAAAKADPAEQAKYQTEEWIGTAIDDLNEQKEKIEFDLEAEQQSGESKGKGKGRSKSNDLEARLTRCKFHVRKLEQLLRRLRCDDIPPEDIDPIEPDVRDFVDNAADLAYDEPNPELYDMFDLPTASDADTEEEEGSDDDSTEGAKAAAAAAEKKSGAAAAAATAARSAEEAPARKGGDMGKVEKSADSAAGGRVIQKKPIEQPPAAVVNVAAVVKGAKPTEVSATATPIATPAKSFAAVAGAKATPTGTPVNVAAAKPTPTPPSLTSDKKTPQFPSGLPTAAKTPASPGGQKSVPAPALSLGGKAPAPAAGSGMRQTSSFDSAWGSAAGGTTTETDLLGDEDDALNDDTFGDTGDMQVGTLGQLSAMTRQSDARWGAPPTASAAAAAAKNAPPLVGTAAPAAPAAGARPKSAWAQPLVPQAAPPAAPAPAPAVEKAAAPAPVKQQPPAAPLSASATASPPGPSPAATPVAGAGAAAAAAVPAAPVVAVSEVAATSAPTAAAVPRPAPSTTSRSAAPTGEPLSLQQTLRMLEQSYANLPHPTDTERQKIYTPANPQQTPAHYPQRIHPEFSNPELFARFDTDVLFFIFYYQQGTYQHYLAAKELKRSHWRYHTKFMTWFQRHAQPKSVTEEQETGTYIYFDFEAGWTQRVKNDFAFRYMYLENEL
jgi:CCR4-NOT transcription complex subunit 3